uniref:Ribonuclease P and MRP subunit p25 n=1 Tax=Leptobrachium leishanense TaxID=445787 RepID=A0A8C5Q0R5_9ANUR
MEYFRRIRIMDEDDGKSLPFKDLNPDVVQMKVKEGSKIRNLIGFAVTHMASNGDGQIVFCAYGRAVTKAVTCVEILKRQVGGLHQITKLQYKTLQEVWEHKGPEIQNPVPCLTVQYPFVSSCPKCPLIHVKMGISLLNPMLIRSHVFPFTYFMQRMSTGESAALQHVHFVCCRKEIKAGHLGFLFYFFPASYEFYMLRGG